MPTSSDPCNGSSIQPDAIISLIKSRPVRKPDAKKFSFTFAQLGEPYPFKDVRTDGQSPSSMDFDSSHLSEESFEGQFQGYRSYSDSDDLDNLVLYNTIGQYSGDPRDVRLFPSRTADVHRRGRSPVKPEEKGSVGLRINQLEGATRRYPYNPEAQARNKSLEEEAQRPEVRALINKYKPFSYSEGGVRKEHDNGGDGFVSTRSKGQGQRCANNNFQENSGLLKSLSPDKDQVGWVLTKKPDISKTDKRLADKHLLSAPGQQTSRRSGSANLSRNNEPQAETDLSQRHQAHNPQYLVNEQVGSDHSHQDSAIHGLTKSKIQNVDRTRSVSKPTLDKSGLEIYAGNDRRPFWRRHSSPYEWNVSQAWQTRSMDDSCFSGPAPSDSSDRSSRIDPQVYQSYTAGILHSSYRSNKFLKLQNYYSMLERVAAIEGQTLAKNAVSGKSRFNLVNIRSKSLGSLAPQSRADNILLQKYDVDNIWELKELYADLEEAQDDEQFLFDTGRVEDFQWNPWEDWGIQNKKLSTQQLQFMFERGLNMNTQASLRKIYRGTDIDFRRELSFRKLYEKYKHLDEETRRQRIFEEWTLRGQRSRKNSESSSTLSYGSNMTGTYLELMEKAAQKARQRALYGYHIPEEYNNYEKHVQRMKKLTRSCPDLNRLLKDKARRSRDRLPPGTAPNRSLKTDARDSPSKVKPRSRSEHRSLSKCDKSNDDFGDSVTKRTSTEIGHLLRQELGETSSTDAGSGIEIRKWRDTTPPWRSKKTTEARKTARSVDGYRNGKGMAERNQRSLEKGDSGLNMSWDDSFDSEEPVQQAERPSRSRTRVRSAWRSEVRSVVGEPMKDLKTETSTKQRPLSSKEESVEQKLENFRKRHGWRKDSKPDPGTVSKALNVFQAMEEEVIVPQHYEPLVGDGNPSLERTRKEAESEAFHAQNYLNRTEDPDLISSHYHFQRSKSVSAKRDPYLQQYSSSTSSARTQIKGHSGLQSSKSEPDLHGKCRGKSEAFLQAKYRFEEMAAESEGSSYPKTGLPSRSPNTALGRYEARIRETSKKGETSQRPRSVGEVRNRSAEYDKFQAELRKHPRNTDEQSTSSWKDKELYLEEHISTKLQATSGNLNPSNRRSGMQKSTNSQEWEEPESPPDGRISRLEMRREVLDGDIDRDNTDVKQPFYSGSNSRPSRGASSLARSQPADDKGFVLVRYPQNEQAAVNEASSSMYETDLDTSMSQPVVRSTDANGADQADFDKSGRRVRPQAEVAPSQNAMTCDEAKIRFQSQDGQQHPREITRMAVISTNAFDKEKPVTDTRPADCLDRPRPRDKSPSAIKPNRRSYSASVLASDPAVHDPAYGDLSKWSRVTLVDGLERSDRECGRLQKWGPTCLNAAATMSSNETFIIKDSDLEMSPHESFESFSGRLPSQCAAEPNDRLATSVGASVSQQGGRVWPTIPRTVSSDPKQIGRESGDDLALTDRQTGKERFDNSVKPVGIPFRRRTSGDRGKDVCDEAARYKWKREYDVPPNVDIEQLRQSKAKKDAALQHALGVVRNYTREAGPQDFYNDLERVGEEWKRDADKKQTRQTHDDGGGSRPLPQYRPPPCYVHPWLEQQSNLPSISLLPQETSKDSVDSFHPPNYSTPCATQSNVILNGQQMAGRFLPQSKSCPEIMPNHQREHGAYPNANRAHPLAKPPFLSSQQASHLQLANTHGMHKPMESRHGDMNPTNQSEHVPTTTASDTPRQRHSVSGTGRSPTGSWDSRRRRDEEAARRKQEMKRITAQEKLKRMEEERKANEARRHNDFLTPSQKSPIPLNRYEDVPDISDLQRPKKKVGVQYRGKARALYNFKAQNPKELSFKKNDIIYLLRQIDKNWYEGEHHGLVGLFPVNYVEVLMSLDEARQAAIMREGRARAKYNFTAQSNMEVSFKKGDTVSLIRRIDNNWFEGRVDGKHGIFPVSYVEVLQEPDTPLPTPMSSYAPTPATGSPGQLSPVSTISNGPAPTIPSAPISPRSSVDNFDFGQPFSFSQYQPSTTTSLQRGTRRDHSYADYGLDPLNQMRPASALGGLTDGYGTMPRDRYNPANRPNSAVPFSDYMKTSTRDSGFYSSEESKYSRQKSREEELMRSLSNPYEGRQSSTSRDSFSRAEEPRYPPYQAMYSYRPQNPDELELREGDIVYVMEKCDDDWYVGTSQRTKEFGTFPGNYVRPL